MLRDLGMMFFFYGLGGVSAASDRLAPVILSILLLVGFGLIFTNYILENKNNR